MAKIVCEIDTDTKQVSLLVNGTVVNPQDFSIGSYSCGSMCCGESDSDDSRVSTYFSYTMVDSDGMSITRGVNFVTGQDGPADEYTMASNVNMAIYKTIKIAEAADTLAKKLKPNKNKMDKNSGY
jgi:hypothetical protein